MATHCFIPVLGKRIRVTKLDACGNVPIVATAKSVVVTDGFITVTLSSEVEDGAEIITRKASGALCVNEKLADNFKRFTIEMEFCGVNPDLLGLTTNAEPYISAADTIGFTVGEGEIDKKWALELWTGLSAQQCEPGQEEASGYLLLPFIQAGVLGDITVDGENAVTFSLTGASTRGGNNWGIGPYKVAEGGTTVAEVQTITITGTPAGGGFILTYPGAGSTTSILYNSTNAVVQTALRLVPGLSDVVVAGGPGPGTPYTVTFPGRDALQMTATHTFTGGTTPNIAVTTTTPGSGPGTLLPVALDALDHLLLMDTGIAPPPSACDIMAMPAA